MLKVILTILIILAVLSVGMYLGATCTMVSELVKKIQNDLSGKKD